MDASFHHLFIYIVNMNREKTSQQPVDCDNRILNEDGCPSTYNEYR